jgi:hypothetical protein
VAQQQLAQSLARAHQIAAHRLAGTDSSRSASSSLLGTRTACRPSIINSRSTRSASR